MFLPTGYIPELAHSYLYKPINYVDAHIINLISWGRREGVGMQLPPSSLLSVFKASPQYFSECPTMSQLVVN